MAIVLVVLTFLLIYVLLLCKRGNDLENLLFSLVLLGIIFVMLTELLGWFQLFSHRFLVASLLLINVVLFVILLGYRDKCVLLLGNYRETLKVILRFLRMNSHLKVFMYFVAFVLGVTLCIALISPPNTWDSMTYHMGRVMHWIQNETISFYPTNILRQLYMTPFSEYVIANLYVLWGSDRFSNMVQWVSMLGSLLGVFLIAKKLVSNSAAWMLSVIFCATIPMGLLQSSSTQTDYVTSLWLVILVYVLLRLREKFEWFYIWMLGGAIGLAFLTKPTAYIFSFPFLVLQLRRLFGKVSVTSILKSVAIIVGFVLLLNAGFYCRNWITFSWVLGPKNNIALVQSKMSGAMFLSNVLKNISFHVATPFTGFNSFVYRSIVSFHKWIGISINDKRLTFGNTKFAVTFSRDEDVAGNPLHFYIVFLCLLFSIFLRKFRVYALSLVGGYLLYCYLLKWQPWGSRLQLPLFVLASPFVGAITYALIGKFRKALFVYIISYMLIFSGFPYLLYGSPRPILGKRSVLIVKKLDIMFAKRPDLEVPYVRACKFLLSRCVNNIGLFIGGDSWEYPVWFICRHDDIHIFHVGVRNVSRKIPRPVSLKIGGIFLVDRSIDSGKRLFSDYKKIYQFGRVRILLKK